MFASDTDTLLTVDDPTIRRHVTQTVDGAKKHWLELQGLADVHIRNMYNIHREQTANY